MLLKDPAALLSHRVRYLEPAPFSSNYLQIYARRIKPDRGKID